MLDGIVEGREYIGFEGAQKGVNGRIGYLNALPVIVRVGYWLFDSYDSYVKSGMAGSGARPALVIRSIFG